MANSGQTSVDPLSGEGGGEAARPGQTVELSDYLYAMPATWTVRGHAVKLDRPLVMGIVNVTPDSFSYGGAASSPTSAIERASSLVAEGADIIDIGGESTRPGAHPVTEQEERDRILPLIKALRAAHPDVLVSVDTVKSGVADAAAQEGVHIVNDVSGMRLDHRMASICARHGVGVVLMHSRGDVADMATYAHAEFDGDVIDVVLDELRARVARARDAGVTRDAIARSGHRFWQAQRAITATTWVPAAPHRRRVSRRSRCVAQTVHRGNHG